MEAKDRISFSVGTQMQLLNLGLNSLIYPKPQDSGKFIPSQVILLKFNRSNNMHRMEFGGDG